MDPIRKPMDQSHTIPFHLVPHTTKTSVEELPHHVHDWHELFIIHQGSCTFFIDDMFYDVKEGDTVIIPGNVIHCSILKKGDTLTTTALFFCPSLLSSTLSSDQELLSSLFFASKQNKQYRYHMAPDKQQEVCSLFEQLKRETMQTDHYSTEMTALIIRTIIILMNRSCMTPNDLTISTPHIPAWIKDSLSYIDTHLKEDLDLTMLARRSSVHPSYFSKTFKTAVGLTYSEFVKSKRMVRAKEWLISTDESIQTIAEECGYSSMPHFFRTFRSITGMTPSSYRKRTLK
ncbi:helix-turn-helix domain-containing protein [Shouchella patagoniensis]|uniref:helix-turn-helix domain-containing protein n=1 Tax=Shouchella patagoniensis TaxID=228576 RepID=UPI00099592E9|nr:AraC family transcriptional regulator [Shouchella patagoniensis]